MDVERTIEFLLQHAARNQAEIDGMKDRITGMMNAMDRVIGIQEQQAMIMTGIAEAQARTDARLDRLTERVDRLTERVDRLAEAQERTDYAIRALMDTVDRILPRPPLQ